MSEYMWPLGLRPSNSIHSLKRSLRISELCCNQRGMFTTQAPLELDTLGIGIGVGGDRTDNRSLGDGSFAFCLS